MEIQKKILGSGHCRSSSNLSQRPSFPAQQTATATTLIISNDEMKYIIKIVRSLEGSGLSLKGVSETVQNEAREQKGGLLSVLLGTLDASLLVNILAGEGIELEKKL